ncbi:MAG: Crp/Fnr family transcriptional regulator [Rhodospirillales bacterium]|nr:Crp/Fnr family transcriptional regulator [Rhodospirillales bacterium]
MLESNTSGGLKRGEGPGTSPTERSVLASFELFDDVEPRLLPAIEQSGRYRRFSAQEQIVDRAAHSTDVFFIVSGRVRVVAYSMSGREITFDDLTAGQYFGEIAAIDGGPRSAGVMSVEDSLVLALPRRQFISVLADHPQVAMRVMQRLARIIRAADERIMDLSTLAANNRVQAELLRQARGDGTMRHTAIIQPIPVHSEIASRVSTTRETVARVLNELSRRGIVERTRTALIIRDVPRLRTMVEEVRG